MRRTAAWTLVLTVGGTSLALAAGQKGKDDGGGAVILGFALAWMAMPAMSTLLAAVAPQLTLRASAQLVERRRTAFWLGLITLGIYLVLVSGFHSLMAQGAGVFGLVNFILVVGFAMVWIVGFSGIAHHIGRCILPAKSISPAAATATGGLTLIVASLFPGIGQVIGFYITCLSIGTFPYAWFGGDVLHVSAEAAPRA